MTILDWFKGLFATNGDRRAYWIYVRCDRCQEVLRTRIDLANDLSVRYDESGRIAGYFTRKTIIGSGQCFNQIESSVEFDARRQAQAHEVNGGQLITAQEYEAANEQAEKQGAEDRENS